MYVGMKINVFLGMQWFWKIKSDNGHFPPKFNLIYDMDDLIYDMDDLIYDMSLK